jgi:hypothetical protein
MLATPTAQSIPISTIARPPRRQSRRPRLVSTARDTAGHVQQVLRRMVRRLAAALRREREGGQR